MEALKTFLRIKRVPKSVMERMKPWDTAELQRREQKVRLKCRSQLDEGIDWELMKKHLQTPEARQAYEDFCRKTRVIVENEVAWLVYRRCPDRYFQYYFQYHYESIRCFSSRRRCSKKGRICLLRGKIRYGLLDGGLHQVQLFGCCLVMERKRLTELGT